VEFSPGMTKPSLNPEKAPSTLMRVRGGLPAIRKRISSEKVFLDGEKIIIRGKKNSINLWQYNLLFTLILIIFYAILGWFAKIPSIFFLEAHEGREPWSDK
jgi:hypothetical protein